MVAIDVLWVGLGGGLGSLLRWWIGLAVGKVYKGSFPLGTFLINISGALLLGYLSTLCNIEWHHRYGSFLNSAVITGVLGGYTTFSSMQLDAAKLASAGARMMAGGYLILSVLTGLLAAAFGAWLAYL